MSNTYFQFKQFKIEQDKCAMKVCTDSCLFGAWIEVDKNVKTILDIGSGTGLLTLMLAQKSAAKIETIEIDDEAFHQAKQNIENSKFVQNCAIYHENILAFLPTKKYDLIVSNPPFYEKDLPSNAANEKVAKHSENLTLNSLSQKAKSLLSINGKFAVLLPYFRLQEMEKIASEYDFYIERKLLVQQTPKHSYFRVCLLFNQFSDTKSTTEIITIKDKNNQYTTAFSNLLEPYYLNL